MKELDFLPPAYREQNAVQKARLCQIAMVVAFGSVIGLAACYQVALYRSAKQQLALISKQHDDAISKTEELAG